MNQCRLALLKPLVAHHKSVEGLQLTVAPLDDPSPLVPSPLPPILMDRNRVIAARRDNGSMPRFTNSARAGLPPACPSLP
jgi:hypothetical protein